MHQWFCFRSAMVFLGLFISGMSGCRDNCDNKDYRCHDNVLQYCQSSEAEPDGYWMEGVDCSDYGATCRSFHNSDLMRATYVETMSPRPDSPLQCVYDGTARCADATEGDSFCVDEGEAVATCGTHQSELLPVITQFGSGDGNAQSCVVDAVGNAVYSYFVEPCEA